MGQILMCNKYVLSSYPYFSMVISMYVCTYVCILLTRRCEVAIRLLCVENSSKKVDVHVEQIVLTPTHQLNSKGTYTYVHYCTYVSYVSFHVKGTV